MTEPLHAAQLNKLFGWCEPSPEQHEALVRIRTAMRETARVVLEQTPWCPDQMQAITLLRQACQMAVSAAINPTGGKYFPAQPRKA